MTEHVTLKIGKPDEVSRLEAAVAELKPALAAYAREHGGRFVLFGSAARREMRPGSDVDILVDFPADGESEAFRFAESETRRLALEPDLVTPGWVGERLWTRMRTEGLNLPGDEERWSRRMSMEDRIGDILDAVKAAAEQFRTAKRFFDQGGLDEEGDTGLSRRMTILYAMLRGHTALEDALVRAMKVLGETPPSGSEWHKLVIERAANSLGAQPAILPLDLLAAVNATRGFRHFAARAYLVPFDPEKARPAVEAGALIAQRLEGEMRKFLEALASPDNGRREQ